MIERPLMTPDELKSLPKGTFVVTKTGFYPMKVKLKLFFQWGIRFDENNPYINPERQTGAVAYASKDRLIAAILKAYPQDTDTEDDGIPGNAMPLEQRRADYDEPSKKGIDPIEAALNSGRSNDAITGPKQVPRETS